MFSHITFEEFVDEFRCVQSVISSDRIVFSEP